jgi:hypothetical protein
MRRLIQPGWVLFQLAVIAFWLRAWYVTAGDQPVNWFEPLAVGIFSAYALTFGLVIIFEIARSLQRLLSGVGERGASADQLARPRTPERLEDRAPKGPRLR